MNAPIGKVEAPWEAVQSLTVKRGAFGQVLHLRLHQGVNATSPGVANDISARQWRRVLRSGLLLGSRGLKEDLAQVGQAATYISGGPVRVQ